MIYEYIYIYLYFKSIYHNKQQTIKQLFTHRQPLSILYTIHLYTRKQSDIYKNIPI